jgi:hypothetical protein
VVEVALGVFHLDDLLEAVAGVARGERVLAQVLGDEFAGVADAVLAFHC